MPGGKKIKEHRREKEMKKRIVNYGVKLENSVLKRESMRNPARNQGAATKESDN